MGSAVVVRPTRRPSRTARPVTPGPASKPRVAAKAAGAAPGAAAGLSAGAPGCAPIGTWGAAFVLAPPVTVFGAFPAGAPSNFHSVRRSASLALPAGEPSTLFASNFSTSRMVPGPVSGGRRHPAIVAAIARAMRAPLALNRQDQALSLVRA